MFFLFSSLLFLSLAVTTAVIINWFCFPIPSGEKQSVRIEKGWSLHHVAKTLKQSGLLKSTACFKVLAWWRQDSTRLQAGDYVFSVGANPWKILDVLVKGKTRLYSITFPEGYNLYEMADLLEKNNFFKKEKFISLSLNPDLARRLLGENSDSLEGYLFPDTYRVTKFVEPQALIQMMTARFFEIYSTLKGKPPLSLSRKNLVTLASIVEKETGAPAERSRIAGVFYNRLKRNMRLESDPTILYGMMRQKGSLIELNIRKKDILKRNAYNTYRLKGFPAGPISNPGLKALQAVFQPETHNFLFFVSRNDGTHVFSNTFKEHQKAVNRWQKSLLKKK